MLKDTVHECIPYEPGTLEILLDKMSDSFSTRKCASIAVRRRYEWPKLC
jgi:hypothetical protein